MTLKLFFILASLEARKRMSYRVDFWLTLVVAFAVEILVAYSLWTALFRASGEHTIGGLTLPGMVLYYVLAILLGKLIRGEDRESTLAQDIYSGSLTRYLVFPVSYFGAKFAERLGSVAPALLQLALFGGLSALFLDLSAAGEVTFLTVARTLVAVVVGNVLAFTMSCLLESVAFWADNVWSLEVLMRFLGFLLGGQLLPLHLFPASMQPVLALLPFRFLYYFPVRTLTGAIGVEEWLAGLGTALLWCGLLALAARTSWRRGLRVYSGVGI